MLSSSSSPAVCVYVCVGSTEGLNILKSLISGCILFIHDSQLSSRVFHRISSMLRAFRNTHLMNSHAEINLSFFLSFLFLSQFCHIFIYIVTCLCQDHPRAEYEFRVMQKSLRTDHKSQKVIHYEYVCDAL